MSKYISRLTKERRSIFMSASQYLNSKLIETSDFEDRLYLVRICDDINMALIKDLLQFVSSEKQRIIQNYKFDIDKKLSLCSDILIRCLACKFLGLRNTGLFFEKNKYGKRKRKISPT